MKTRILIVASLAMLLISCDMNIMWEPIPVDPPINDSIPNDSIPNDSIPNDSIISEPVPSPDDLALAQQLIGVWNTAPSDGCCRSLLFTESGQFVDRGTMAFSPMPNYGSYKRGVQYVYSIVDGKLIYSTDTTSFHIDNDVLTIDFFRISGVEVGQIVLKKAYEVPAVPLSQESIYKLNALYSLDTLKSFAGPWVVASRDIDDIYGKSYPRSFIPEFNSDKHTLILARTPFYRREGLNVKLYYNQDMGFYEYVGEGHTSEGKIYAAPYGIYDIPYETLHFVGTSSGMISTIMKSSPFIYTY